MLAPVNDSNPNINCEFTNTKTNLHVLASVENLHFPIRKPQELAPGVGESVASWSLRLKQRLPPS